MQSGGNTNKCKSCGSVQHRSELCKYRNAACHHCQWEGHICPVRKARLSQVQLKGRSSGQKSAKLNCCDSNTAKKLTAKLNTKRFTEFVTIKFNNCIM